MNINHLIYCCSISDDQMEDCQSIDTFMEPIERSPLQKGFMFAGLIEASDLKLLEKIGQGEQWNFYERNLHIIIIIMCIYFALF